MYEHLKGREQEHSKSLIRNSEIIYMHTSTEWWDEIELDVILCDILLM